MELRPPIKESIKHLYCQDGKFTNDVMDKKIQEDLESRILPFIEKYEAEGYPMAEILFFIMDSVSFIQAKNAWKKDWKIEEF